MASEKRVVVEREDALLQAVRDDDLKIGVECADEESVIIMTKR